MKFSTCQFTNPGGRSPNEDSVGYFSNDNYAWIAADGLGGHISGEIASAEAVRYLKNEFYSSSVVNKLFMENAFKKMNDSIFALNGPLTTAVCAFSDGKTLWYGNIGDSRIYFIRNKKIMHHSNDHSVAYVDYLCGNITYDEITVHPAQNRLFHSLGTEINFFGEFYTPVTLEDGDAFILLTDGFWELINTEEIVRTLKISRTSEEWMGTMLDIVESRLKSNSDNYSAVCVMVKSD
ncbi:MAG: serine/threonine-protein phosphatase [Anaerolineaceae bacterium]|nr:serine/threonine-protein phosphatase [Anaerolineaceae bacterium]